jgi:UDP-N-acetylmuramoyl-tripeptide--D-alanyl-D-alanine ligase
MKSTMLNLQLALLQAEHYETGRYLAGRKNINPELVRRMRMTARLKLTRMLSYLLGIVGANVLIGTVVAVYEYVVWNQVKHKIADLKSKGLKVIAIAGSYGKTSVKHYAYELLRHKYKTVATPASFNTVLGIAKCLEYEVDDKTEVFIVEVGAYHIGDITHLLTMASPDIGILTGMARQHLERFGSWENIQQAKSEIARYMHKSGGSLVANGSDEVVVKNVEKLGVKTTWYRGDDRHEINLRGAKKAAELVGMSMAEIKKIRVREPRSRFEMTTKRYGMRVIDDSFSSNNVGFVEAVKYLGKQTAYTRILVTPGLVELGSESNVIHEQLGRQITPNADLVLLVGKNERTNSLERGIGKGVKVLYIPKTLDFMQVVKDLKLKKEPLVLIENDVTENY